MLMMRKRKAFRVDTHTHPNISKRLPFHGGAIDRIVSMARRVGLDGVALTEHLHCPSYWDVWSLMARTCSIAKGVFWSRGVALVPGGEVNIREGAHIIVLGEVNEIRRLDFAFPRALSRGYEPTFEEFLEVSERYDIVRIGAHMFREKKELSKFPDAQLSELDALEVNGKDFGTEERLLARARDLKLPVVAGSDAHHWLQVGVRHTLVEADELGLSAVMRAVREGRTSYDGSALTPIRVRAAKSWKTYSKNAAAAPAGGGWPTRPALAGPMARALGLGMLDVGNQMLARARMVGFPR